MSLCSPQVKVVELKVTWITKSYSPKGSDSVYPPPSTITQENLCRWVQIFIHVSTLIYLCCCELCVFKLLDRHIIIKEFEITNNSLWLGTVLVGFRVRRLGYYDHTQRQLGERALYVFPAKGDATRITCEGPEGAPILPEDPVARRVIAVFDSV